MGPGFRRDDEMFIRCDGPSTNNDYFAAAICARYFCASASDTTPAFFADWIADCAASGHLLYA